MIKSNVINFNEIENILKYKRENKINIDFKLETLDMIDEIIKLRMEKTLMCIQDEVKIFLIELGLEGKSLKNETKKVTYDLLSDNIDYLILPISLSKYINYAVIDMFTKDEIYMLETLEFEILNYGFEKRIIDFCQ